MRFAIVGAGATGAFLGAHLARAGLDVVLVARGAHLEAMRSRGVRVLSPEGDFIAHPECTDDLSVVSEADVAFLTLKAHSLPGIAGQLAASLGPETAVVTAQNGIPWWYFQREGGPLEGTRLSSVDPDGLLSDSIDGERIVGCVVYPATELVEPGVIRHVEGSRFSIGELDGSRTDRCQAISAALIQAGLKCPIRTRIRDEIWLKLLGNVAFNPISALTRATMDEIMSLPETRDLARTVMVEADSVAEALGVKLSVGIDRRLAGGEAVGGHKTSMLQDLERGRPLELEALAGAVLEIGGLLNLALPTLRCIYACTRLLDCTLRGEQD
jgi:2-dehydropantoate 2-reductase